MARVHHGLPPPEGAAQSNNSNSRFTRSYRLARLLLHIVYGCVGVNVAFPVFSRRLRVRSIQRWSRQVLGMLHVRVSERGSLPPGRMPTLIVSNHISWLDICILHSLLPIRFVAKSDVRGWPLVGSMAVRTGTIFIDRSNPVDTMRVNRTIVDAFERGEYVVVFPEGTSTDGTELKPFRASLFQPALEAGARVAVLAIRYVNPDGSVNQDASYAGDRSLWGSFKLVCACRSVQAEVIFAGSIDVGGKTRAEVACAAEAAAADALELPRPGPAIDAAVSPGGATSADLLPRRSALG
jgi:1-acyl-sn-glycerol-3-phosphate acyltransferase